MSTDKLLTANAAGAIWKHLPIWPATLSNSPVAAGITPATIALSIKPLQV
jgi:hypothetical protein